MLYSQCIDWIGGDVRRGRNDVCRHHMFTQHQPQQRSSPISRVPGQWQQSTNSMGSRQAAWPRLCMLDPSQHSTNLTAALLPSSLMPLKRMLLVFPTLSSTPTHLTGAAKAVTKLPGDSGPTPCTDAPQLLRGPFLAEWMSGSAVLEVKKGNHDNSSRKWFTASQEALSCGDERMCSLSCPHSADRLKQVQRVRDLTADAGGTGRVHLKYIPKEKEVWCHHITLQWEQGGGGQSSWWGAPPASFLTPWTQSRLKTSSSPC